MLLGEITMDEFKRGLRKTKTMIIPYGTVEEHGKHLPLSTDTMIAEECLRRVVQKKRAFLAPPVHYGVCTSTRMHPGTITIRPETLRMLTFDIVREAYKKGIRNFLLISGHGGGLHMNALKEVAEELVEEIDDLKIAVLSPWDICWEEISRIAETENDSHAGEIETSLILALRPDLVKGRSKEEYPRFPKPLVVRDKLKYWKGGVWGDPGKASKEKGERVIDLVVERISEVMDVLEK